MRPISFSKGHGTGNDFVIVVAQDNADIDADDVRWLTDRQFGVGGDGLLRVVKGADVADWQGDSQMWFMDYRNADGSIAEMCGNGLRVFARYLVENRLTDQLEFDVATRAGIRHVRVIDEGLIETSMGQVTVSDTQVTVSHQGYSWPAIPVNVGNSHAVVFVEHAAELAELSLNTAPTWQPIDAYPTGVNVEFVHVFADDHLAMRVHERGSGETLSCGTGIVASASAHLHRLGRNEAAVTVDVQGGRLIVEITPEGVTLTGPALIVAHGEAMLPEREAMAAQQ